MPLEPIWLYHSLFKEVQNLWNKVQQQAAEQHTARWCPPTFFVIQECGEVDWEKVYTFPPLLREWTYEGVSLREQTPSKKTDFVLTGDDTVFYKEALIQFYVRSDHERVAFTTVLGPRYGIGYILVPCLQDGSKTLVKEDSKYGWKS
jgi:hypothetical protein